MEPIGRRAAVVELGDGQGRRQVGRLGERQVDAVVGERRREPLAEAVGRQAAEEADRAAEPGDRPGRVERAAAGDRVEPSVGMDEQVDQGLAGDDDHARHRSRARTLRAMDRRTDAVELLDGPLDDPAALAANLRDLRRINDRLGGVSLTAPAIEALAAHRAELSLLDVGTGGADIPLALLALAAARRAATDGRRHRQPARGPVGGRPRLARRWRRRTGSNSTSGTVGRSPTPIGRSTSSMPRSSSITARADDAAGLLRGDGAGSRASASWSTTSSGRWRGWVGAWLIGHLLTRNRYTRHDAPLSVRRAYRADEVAAMLRAAGLTPVRTLRGAPGASAMRWPPSSRPSRPRVAVRRTRSAPGSDGVGPGRPDRGRESRSRSSEAVRRARSWRPGWPSAGDQVVILERSPAWRWRAGGVFASPAAVAALRRAGVDGADARRRWPGRSRRCGSRRHRGRPSG